MLCLQSYNSFQQYFQENNLSTESANLENLDGIQSTERSIQNKIIQNGIVMENGNELVIENTNELLIENRNELLIGSKDRIITQSNTVNENIIDENFMQTSKDNSQVDNKIQNNTEFLTIKQFLERTSISKLGQNSLMLCESSEDLVVAKKIGVTMRSVKTQTQPIIQYLRLTPAAAKLEAMQKKTTVIIEDPMKYSCDVRIIFKFQKI